MTEREDEKPKRGTLLFRPEVFENRRHRLQGSVHIVLPRAWQMIGYLLLAFLCIGLVFVLSADYARTEHARGAVISSRGIATVVAIRPGIVTAVHVEEGTTVEAGAPLITISVDERSDDGKSLSAGVTAALEEQDESIARQQLANSSGAQSEIDRLLAVIDGLEKEIEIAQRQRGLQEQLVRLAERDLQRRRAVADQGLVSAADVDAREDGVVSRKLDLQVTEQTIVSKIASLAAARGNLKVARAQVNAQRASFEGLRAELKERLAAVSTSKAYSLTAPVEGIVTAVTGHVGMSVDSTSPLMVIVPTGASLQAEIYLSATAIAFIQPQQVVKLSIDAFPFQQFGSVVGRVKSVSSAPVAKRGESGDLTITYFAVVDLEAPYVMAYDRPHRLIPGMTLSARIKTREQSLFQWLFEPLFAVSRR